MIRTEYLAKVFDQPIQMVAMLLYSLDLLEFFHRHVPSGLALELLLDRCLHIDRIRVELGISEGVSTEFNEITDYPR